VRSALLFFAAISTAHAAVIFNNPTLAWCQAAPESAGPATGSVGTAVSVRGGSALSLSGTCSLLNESAYPFEVGVMMTWEGTFSPLSRLNTGDLAAFGYDFWASNTAGKDITWRLLFLIISDTSPTVVYSASGTTKSNVPVSFLDGNGQWGSPNMTPTRWNAIVSATFSAQPGDRLTLTIPAQSSIDFNNIPEPATITFIAAGIVLLLVRRR